jgi:hypothetical protein
MHSRKSKARQRRRQEISASMHPQEAPVCVVVHAGGQISDALSRWATLESNFGESVQKDEEMGIIASACGIEYRSSVVRERRLIDDGEGGVVVEPAIRMYYPEIKQKEAALSASSRDAILTMEPVKASGKPMYSPQRLREIREY